MEKKKNGGLFCCSCVTDTTDVNLGKLHTKPLKITKEAPFKWSHETILHYSNTDLMLKPEFQKSKVKGYSNGYILNHHQNGFHKLRTPYEQELKEQSRNEYIGDKYNNVFDFLMKESKAKLLKNLGTSNPAVLNREWEQATRRIKSDVA